MLRGGRLRRRSRKQLDQWILEELCRYQLGDGEEGYWEMQQVP